MANHYLQFCEVIPDITPEEETWIRNRVQEMNDKFSDASGEDGWYFEWKITKDPDDKLPHLTVYAEESAEPEHVAAFAQEFLRKFRQDSSFHLSWAGFCDKLRPGEFGGGAVFVTAETQEWMGTYDFIEEQKALFTKPKDSKPVSKKKK